METALALLVLFSLVALFIGLIRPSVFSRVLKGMATRKGIVLIFGLSAMFSLALLGVILPPVESTSDKSRQAKTIAMQATAPKTKPFIQPPQLQLKLQSLVYRFAEFYEAAPNELKKSMVFKERQNAIKELLPGKNQVNGWVGTLESMGTTSGEKDAHVTIRLNKRITMKTWNNSFSDIGDKTLIPMGSSVFNSLVEMSEGQMVRFSGSILQEGSITEEGGMTEPEFIMRFTALELAKR